MSAGPELILAGAAHGDPDVWLLDARRAGTDAAGLRARARAHGAGVGARARVTRAYCFPYALVAAHAARVGVDIERVAVCDCTFADSICTPAERPLVAASPDRDLLVTSLWSAKEALAKALGDARAYDPRGLGAPVWWQSGRAGIWAAAALDAPAGHVAWVCWERAAGAITRGGCAARP